MKDRRLRRIMRPLTRSARAAADRFDGVVVRRRAERLLEGIGDWEIGTLHRARSGTRIARLRSARSGRDAILKITDAPEGALGLDRERTVLSRLAAEPRLEALRPLVPDVLAAGSADGWSYVVQRSLPGVPAPAGAMRPPRSLLAEASALAARMHEATAMPRTIAEAEVDAWIGRPIAAVRDLAARRLGPSEIAALDHLAVELEMAVTGATVPLGWMHGDLWSQNILVDDDPAGTITGLVDWDSASDAGLAAHDQLHLVLYTRKVLDGTEIGVQICRALRMYADWDAAEESALATATAHLPGVGESTRRRLAIHLYWLRLVAMNLARQPRATRAGHWLDDNVRAVLACR
jgi:Ser/Thr protein kinase RdoA (MazF antagonist)